MKKIIKTKKVIPDIHLLKSDIYFDLMEFEERLGRFLSTLNIHEKLTVDDMKDMIWNDDDIKLPSRMITFLLENASQKDFQKGADLVMEAWNHFPHNSLNGLSPREMVERSRKESKGEKNTAADLPLKYRRNFYEIFSKRFPKDVRIVKRAKNEWEFEYPIEIQMLRSMIRDLDAIDEDIGEELDEQLMEDRMLLDNAEDIVEMMKIAVEKHPLFFEGAIRIAKNAFMRGDAKSARNVLENSITAGRALLPKDFKLGKDILMWAMLENRPFMLLLGEYATFVDTEDGPLQAIPLYEEMIALNPNDNQGMRAFLATAYLKTGKLEKLLVLSEKYPEDMVQELVTGKILALYKLGRLDEVKAAIKMHKKYNLHVFKEILKIEHPQPELIPGRVRVGGEDEAWLYWQAQGNIWMTTPGAREFLKEEMEK